MLKNSIILLVASVCLLGLSSAFELKECVQEMEAAFEGFQMPEPVQRLVAIVQLANEGRRLLDEPNSFVLRQLKSRPYPAECDTFNQEVRKRIGSVQCSESIRMEDNEHREAVADSKLDLYLGAIGACSVSKTNGADEEDE